MPVLLVTHAELYRDQYPGDTPHSYEALEKVKKVVEMTMALIANDAICQELTVLFMGEGNRYKDVFVEFRRCSSFESHGLLGDQYALPMIAGISMMLGGPSSRRSEKRDLVYGCGGLGFPRPHCHLLSDCITQQQAWEYVQRVDQMAPGYKIFCSGRQQLKSLGQEKEFKIASVFQLDWETKSVKCRIRDARFVP